MSRYLYAQAIFVLDKDLKYQAHPLIEKGTLLVKGMDNEWYHPSREGSYILGPETRGPDCWPITMYSDDDNNRCLGIRLFRDYWNIIRWSLDAPAHRDVISETPKTLIVDAFNNPRPLAPEPEPKET